METELLNQITHLVISLLIVLQIMPWALLMTGFFIMRQLNRHGQTYAPNTTVKTTGGNSRCGRST